MARHIHIMSGLLLACLLTDWIGVSVGHAFEEWKDQRETLRGLDELGVKVRIGTSLDGPTRRALQSDVEQALRRLPVRILPEPGSPSFSKPALIVEVAMVKMRPRSFVHCMTVRLHQAVTLKRDREQSAYAVTWQASAIGDGDLDNIRKKIQALIAVFIDDYRRVNAAP